MKALEQRVATIANNLANVNTAGFKRQENIDKGFDFVLFQEMRKPYWLSTQDGPGGGVRLDDTFTDFSNGMLNMTGRDLDVALQGPGYFAVETPEGARYTRNGQFFVDPDGDVSTTEGYKVLATDGQPIRVGNAPVEVSDNGFVLAFGAPVAQLRTLEFEDPRMLERVGDTYYFAPDAAVETAVQSETTRYVPRSLESSNVQVPYEMVQMIAASRAYSANQRVINAFDDTMSRLIDQVATPL
jgi:flagellar basal-body rod protein FlgG